MAHLDKIAPGNFCWIELATTDQPHAKKFYAELFGWAFEDAPMGPNDFYTMFNLEGRKVAAAYTLRADQLKLGIPPHWNVYISVESAEAAAARASSLGATVLAGPLDVFDAGRMATIQDPTGATVSLWEPGKHPGFRISKVPGTFCAADLSTSDQEAASRFYEQLFGWHVEKEDENSSHNYFHLFYGGEFIGGILPPAFRKPGTPPHWQIYILVADCDVSAAKAQSLGAKLFLPPMIVENIGRMAVIADPQGAVIALFQTL
jgi:uncharacterized protein